MAYEKLIVNMNSGLKRAFMAGCSDRMMSASAVVRHLIELQLREWEKTDADVIQKIKK